MTLVAEIIVVYVGVQNQIHQPLFGQPETMNTTLKSIGAYSNLDERFMTKDYTYWNVSVGENECP